MRHSFLIYPVFQVGVVRMAELALVRGPGGGSGAGGRNSILWGMARNGILEEGLTAPIRPPNSMQNCKRQYHIEFLYRQIEETTFSPSCSTHEGNGQNGCQAPRSIDTVSLINVKTAKHMTIKGATPVSALD
jgi:hypothetical protein